MADAIRVLLVDDHPLVIDGIQARLENEGGIEVVGQAGNGLEAIKLAQELKPDVVLMDVSMPVMNGLEATRELRARSPETRVLILSMHDNREYMVQLIQSGARGYILKDVSAAEMVKAIETVCQGGTYFSASASQTLFSHATQPEVAPGVPEGVITELTPPRELWSGVNWPRGITTRISHVSCPSPCARSKPTARTSSQSSTSIRPPVWFAMPWSTSWFSEAQTLQH